MASAPDSRGNCDLFSPHDKRIVKRAEANTFVANALGAQMRASRKTNEMLEDQSGVPERQIEKLRSFTEETPINLEDVLSIAAALGRPYSTRFLTTIFSEVEHYAAPYNGGSSPEKIASEIMRLAAKLTGEKVK
jgi:hypothetical protein